MSLNILRLIALLPLIKGLEAQFLSEPEARLQAWRAYGSFVQQSITAGVALTPGKDMVYITPPNFATVRGGTPCPDEITNYELFSLVDRLQNGSEPLLDLTGPSYAEALLTYLEGVDLKTALPTAAQKAKIEQLTTDLDNAQYKFEDESSRTFTRYYNDVRAQAAGQAFGSWVTKNAPSYGNAKRQMQDANTALQNYQVSVYGPQARQLGLQRDRILLQALEEVYPEPGYNMPTYTGNYNVQTKPWAVGNLPSQAGVVYKPTYNLLGGFEEVYDKWLNGTATGTTSYTFNMKNSGSSDWSSLGHTGKVTNVGASYFGLLNANYGRGASTTTFDKWSSNFNSAISVTLTMKGAPQVFAINPGYWDVGGVRSTYPNLVSRPGFSDPLVGRVRLTRILVGYEIGMTITVTDTALYKSMSQFIQTAQRSTGGGFSLFGFRFGASQGTTSTRSTSSISLTETSSGGRIVIPPSAPGLTYMLGALGKVM